MSKTYNLGKSSSTICFANDFEEKVMDIARDAAYDMEFDIACPHCNVISGMRSGLNICPFCKNEVNVELDIHF